ncbi:MAG: homoserine dehydrogenase [Thermoguttaceae bacterium]|nr:homoserine dehydrogenase [Thermoguttaceae bacterium]MDW8039099.1 homoserine dehydrogenase [Thermoguttaceae bacterium]
MKPIKVAIIGFGTVGSGVAKLLLEERERLARQVGCPLELARVVDVDLERPRNVRLPPGLLTDQLSTVLEDPEIQIAVELIGGLEPARTIVLRLLEAGKDVVTANKALLAEHGTELFEAARKYGRSIAFEASVAGGIPIIAAIAESLAANQIQSIYGILNGTTNFILTQMAEQGSMYADALRTAQQLGYAEADPSLDVNGTDAAQKLAILAHLAFGVHVRWQEIPRTGIDTVQAADMKYAAELGYTIKLLAVAELVGGGLELHVSPTLVSRHNPLAHVRGAFNAIRVVGDAVGPVFFHGQGAGQMPTASAVTADIISTALGRTAITFRTLRLWSPDRPSVVPLRDPAAISSRYYLRLNVEDRPGVLAEIAGILGAHQVSIASVIQHETEEPGDHPMVPLVIMTHSAPAGKLAESLAKIERLSCVEPGVVCMRVLS